MGIVADLVQSWQGGEGLYTAIRAAASAEDLREKLDALGVRLDLDPDECSRRNHQLVETVAGGVERLRLAWWLKSGANDRYGEWHGDTEGYRAAAAGRLDRSAAGLPSLGRQQAADGRVAARRTDMAP